MKKITKISLGLGSAAIVTVPIITIAVLNKNDDDFKEISFAGKVFHSKLEILNYIDNNSKEENMRMGSKLYTIQIGNDQKTFDSYKKAIDFVKSKIVSKKVYLKPGIKKMSNVTMGADSFVEFSTSRKYIVFQKYSNDLDKSNTSSGKIEHSFTYAPLPKDSDSPEYVKKIEIEIENARLEAAKSFLQVHNGYLFDGIFFKTTNDLREFLISRKSSMFKKVVKGEKMSVLDTKKGALMFKSNDKRGIINVSKFNSQVSKLATPIFSKKDSKGQTVNLELNQSNKTEIAMNLPSSSLDMIKVAQNEDEVTQIVDMDSSTPNGRIYGNYFFKTGGSMDGVTVRSNWGKAEAKDMSAFREQQDVTMINSILDYVLMSHGLASVQALFSKTLLPKQSNPRENMNFWKFLGQSKFIKGNFNLREELKSLLGQLRKGSRYSTLNTIIASHSFVINKMIRNGIYEGDIEEVSRYFDSMMAICDGFLGTLISPFLASKNSVSRIKFSYLRDAFHFYDPGKNGKGIEFQNNPFSYYRKLFGHLGDDNKSNGETSSSRNRKSIFNMLKASMGMNAILFNGLIKNQETIAKWEQRAEFLSKRVNRVASRVSRFISPGFEEFTKYNKLSFNKNDAHGGYLVDLSFSGPEISRKNNSKEYISIWKNLNWMTNGVEIMSGKNYDTKQVISKKEIIENAKNYIMNFQNNVIKNYEEKILDKMDYIIGKYQKGNWKERENGKIKLTSSGKPIIHADPIRWNEKEASEDFATNTFNFITLDADIENFFKRTNTIASTYDGYKHLKEMNESLIEPVWDRIKPVIISIKTVSAEVSIAVATAGASAQEEVAKRAAKKMISKGSKSSSRWIRNATSKMKSNKIFKMNLERDDKVEVSKLLDKVAKDFGRNSGSNFSKTLIGGVVIGTILSFGDIDLTYNKNIDKAYKFMVRAFAEYVDIQMSVIKNVIPGINKLFEIVEKFNYSKTQVYVFRATEDGTKIFWDGGKVDYSWWGLSQNVVYDINSLSMFVTPDIISGYGPTSSGVYIDNKIETSENVARYKKAREIIEAASKHDDIYFSENPIFKKFIKWTLPLTGQGELRKIVNEGFAKDTIQELQKMIKRIVEKNKITRNVYIDFRTKLESNNYEKTVDALTNSIKASIIFKLPSYKNKNITSDKIFELPKPYYSGGSIVRLSPNENNNDYIIFDPNIDDALFGDVKEIMKELVKPFNKSVDKLKDDDKQKYNELKVIANSLINLSRSKYFGDDFAIQKLAEQYAKNIFVPNKEVIYEVIQGQNNLINTVNDNWTKGTYEYLDNSWTKKPETIYITRNQFGQEIHHLSKKHAFKELIGGKNYNLGEVIMGRNSHKYKFNKMIFNSIEEIYNYIIKNSKRGSNV